LLNGFRRYLLDGSGENESHGLARGLEPSGARRERGNIDLIDKTLRAKAPANLKADFDKAAGPALDSLRAFNSYLKDDLSKRTSDWRLGKERYSKKFAYTLVAGKNPEEVLSEAKPL